MTNYLRSIKENNNKMELTNTGMSKEVSKTGERLQYSLSVSKSHFKP